MKKIFYSALGFVLSATQVLALEMPATIKKEIKNETLDEFTKLVFTDYVTYVINLFWVLVVVYGVFAAFKYLTAKGDPKAADVASQMFKYTVIGACVALLATVIKEIAKSILGG